MKNFVLSVMLMLGLVATANAQPNNNTGHGWTVNITDVEAESINANEYRVTFTYDIYHPDDYDNAPELRFFCKEGNSTTTLNTLWGYRAHFPSIIYGWYNDRQASFVVPKYELQGEKYCYFAPYLGFKYENSPIQVNPIMGIWKVTGTANPVVTFISSGPGL